MNLSATLVGFGTVCDLQIYRHFNGYYLEFIAGTVTAMRAEISITENGSVVRRIKFGKTVCSMFTTHEKVQLEID